MAAEVSAPKPPLPNPGCATGKAYEVLPPGNVGLATPLHVATSVARILQWKGFENDITFDHTLYTGADPERLSGVYIHVILN